LAYAFTELGGMAPTELQRHIQYIAQVLNSSGKMVKKNLENIF